MIYPIWWIIPSLLGGMTAPKTDQLLSLKNEGLYSIINLQSTPPDTDIYKTLEIQSLWLPIVDFGVPSFEQLIQFCDFINQQIKYRQMTLVHCTAGLGRTGTMLAAFKVSEGMTPTQAIHFVHQIQPRAIETAEQISFIRQLQPKFNRNTPSK